MLDRVYDRHTKQGGEGAPVLPFRALPPREARPYENCVPLYDLKVAAGLFLQSQAVDAVMESGQLQDTDQPQWVELPPRFTPSRDLFVTQVVGESMNRRIPNGAWCLFRLNPGCDGESGTQIVLAQLRDIEDPETGGRFTVKAYRRETVPGANGEEARIRVVLSPLSTQAGQEPIVLADLQDGGLQVIAALVSGLAVA